MNEIKIDVGPWMEEVAAREIRSRRMFRAGLAMMLASCALLSYSWWGH